MRKKIVPLMAVFVVAAIVMAGCAKPSSNEPAPAEVTTWTTPELLADYQSLVIDKGLVDSSLVLNPYEGGLATKPDGTPLRVRHSTHILPVDYCMNHDGLMKSFVERAGGTYSSFDANLVVDAQIADLDNIIAQKSADVLILHPVEEYSSVPAVERVVAAGIPVFTWDATSPTEAVTSFAHHKFDGPAGTNVVAEYLVELAEKENKQINLLEIWAIPDSVHIQSRHVALHEVIDGHPLINVVAETAGTGGSSETTAAYVEDAVGAHPEINAIFGDGGGQDAAVDGLRAAGRLFKVGDPNHIILIGNDTDARTIQAVVDGYWDAFGTHQPWDLADLPVKLLLTSVILGESVPQEVVVPMEAVTSENIETIKVFGATPCYVWMPAGNWDLWPVLDTSEIGLEAPTVEMRKDLKGY